VNTLANLSEIKHKYFSVLRYQNMTRTLYLINCFVRFAFEYFSCHHHEHTDERDVLFFYHYIQKEINNKIILFVEKQNQPLAAAMNYTQVTRRTIDKGASGKSF